jgi:hypothetical protein
MEPVSEGDGESDGDLGSGSHVSDGVTGYRWWGAGVKKHHFQWGYLGS